MIKSLCVQGSAIIAWMVLLLVPTAQAAGIYVLSTSLSKPNVIEKELGAKIPSASLKVFARFSDFKAMVEREPPDVVIAPALTIGELGFTEAIKLQGLVGGKDALPMVLVVLDGSFSLTNTPEAQIGVLDVAGRQAMKQLVAQNTTDKCKPKLVSKLEDLLPMLTFRSADAVLLTQADAEELKKRSQAKLVSIPLKGEAVGAVAVAIVRSGDNAARIVGEIRGLGKADLKLLGVESWK